MLPAKPVETLESLWMEMHTLYQKQQGQRIAPRGFKTMGSSTPSTEHRLILRLHNNPDLEIIMWSLIGSRPVHQGYDWEKRCMIQEFIVVGSHDFVWDLSERMCMMGALEAHVGKELVYRRAKEAA